MRFPPGCSGGCSHSTRLPEGWTDRSQGGDPLPRPVNSVKIEVRQTTEPGDRAMTKIWPFLRRAKRAIGVEKYGDGHSSTAEDGPRELLAASATAPASAAWAGGVEAASGVAGAGGPCAGSSGTD